MLKVLEIRVLPRAILVEASKELYKLAARFTGIAHLAEDGVVENSDKYKDCTPLLDMYHLTMLPCEPRLYPIMRNEEFSQKKTSVVCKRTDTRVFNRFCRYHCIRKTRVLRCITVWHPM